MKNKKITLVCRIRKYDNEENVSRGMTCHDKNSRKYITRYKNTITFSELIGEFENDDLVEIIMKKVGKV